MSNNTYYVPSNPTAPPHPEQIVPPPSYTPPVGQPVYPAAYAPIQITPGRPIQSFNVNQVWGKAPQQAFCTYCRNHVTTRVDYNTGMCTWLSCVACSFFGFNLGCCLVPFCINEFKDSYHYCSLCGGLLGIHKPIN